MYVEYFHWHYVVAPQWLARFVWTAQRALFRMFSVPFMFKTLLAHWRRDTVGYRSGTISGLLTIFAWNQISRAIGLFIRSCVIAVWFLCEIIFLVATIIGSLIFLLAPLLVIVAVVTGVLWVGF